MNRWIERWHGSGPDRGWSIWEMTTSTHGDRVAYVGEGEHSERLTALIVQKHNDSLAAAAPEAPAQAAQSAGEVERGDVVAFEFYNRATGHAIVDYSVNTHVGTLGAERGYEARPLVYARRREKVTDGSKPIPLWQAHEALDELEASARGDAPFNHHAAAVIRAALEVAEQPRQMVALTAKLAKAKAVVPVAAPPGDDGNGEYSLTFYFRTWDDLTDAHVAWIQRMHGIPAPGGKE